jgi:hypothetical protein
MSLRNKGYSFPMSRSHFDVDASVAMTF